MLKTIVFFCVITLMLPGWLAAQESNEAILVDEFEMLGCCDFRSRLDWFFSELANNPNDLGLIVTAGPDDKSVQKVVREEMIRSHSLLRSFDPSRLRFVRARGVQLQTKLFRLANGSPVPPLPGTDNTYALELNEPTRLLVDYPHGDGGLCPYVDYRQIFALFLAANSASRAKMVIRGYSTRDARKLERELIRYFVNDSAVDRNRIQFARDSLLAKDADFGPATEYWLLP